MRWSRVAWLLTAVAVVASGCGSTPEPPAEPAAAPAAEPARSTGSAPSVGPERADVGSAQRLRVEVLDRYPHDTGAFTQGLEIDDDVVYEGTGQYGESELRIVDLDTGAVRQRVSLPDTVFGEGITVLDDRVWQISWRDGIAYERDPETLAERRQVRYEGEGWGICHDDAADRLIMSDGTDQLTFRDPETFVATGTVSVTLDGGPLRDINELECVGGAVWANVWRTDRIVRIDPSSGQVAAQVDAAGLLTGAERAGTDVLNGIAAVSGTDEFLLTGKYWPTLFRVRFVPAS
ncbi:glutaminyl-peptide cyclotransferase [Solwaraspora sp. WMMD406]|uniref:glutaminyl-peptide cyclotransferase n=1 Tax=Solwaraspora sp. WMMD406 TaxID=3016095 RepID=UPI00241641AA|nr:glutaminyl-peptide cyclotransferase [Solwaraspora sp. WMMD406]MDG4763431.1 glutaminyl-peptide cyclotransferase [Solwaraspora sp. WMMD406]